MDNTIIFNLLDNDDSIAFARLVRNLNEACVPYCIDKQGTEIYLSITDGY